ncbi:MAG: 50S ribosomal protein L18 [Planctomycetota bacterium]|jgi:large subunit ribosomal protein L18|nr:50S ribosomal protein L18 [Planctomycetota bacterium]
MERILKKRYDLARRHRRLRQKVRGSAERPRLAVFRSVRHISVQFIDDAAGRTLLALSTCSPDFPKETYGGNVKAAETLGGMAAEKARGAGIQTVVFDCGGRKYHGRVKALAEAARKGGLQF